jgi:hypothetical protein
MSYTTTYGLFRTKVSAIREHRNSWGSAPVVWDYLEAKYLEVKEYSRAIRGDMQEVWNLHKDTRLLACERFALLTTFDWAYCSVDKLTMGADLLDEFAVLSEAWAPDRVNHWKAIAEDYRSTAIKPDYRLKGICIGHTSVSDPWEEWTPSYKTPWAIGED